MRTTRAECQEEGRWVRQRNGYEDPSKCTCGDQVPREVVGQGEDREQGGRSYEQDQERERQRKWKSRGIEGNGGPGYGVEMQRKPSPKFILYEWDPVFLLTATGHDLVGYGYFSEDQQQRQASLQLQTHLEAAPQQQLHNDSKWSWSVPKYKFNDYCDFKQQQQK